MLIGILGVWVVLLPEHSLFPGSHCEYLCHCGVCTLSLSQMYRVLTALWELWHQYSLVGCRKNDRSWLCQWGGCRGSAESKALVAAQGQRVAPAMNPSPPAPFLLSSIPAGPQLLPALSQPGWLGPPGGLRQLKSHRAQGTCGAKCERLAPSPWSRCCVSLVG